MVRKSVGNRSLSAAARRINDRNLVPVGNHTKVNFF